MHARPRHHRRASLRDAGLQRIWTARIAVDASQCATTSGRFFIRFVRLKEVGPDVRFAEAAADEAVRDYSIGYVRPCACREIGSR